MKIKKLEINGFKSFVGKTSIEFPPGISAVVGPNGCGKSNVVDALRWVMGEQSAKQLRGKAMEDVIFGGTNGNPPLNMAEVSLTLLNDNGTAPEELKEFTEIMLTRRLYRSGESSYFINKQGCRLKDIHNIFMGSGMGVKSYAVVQQGNITAITDASPEERRFFIEQAAGITRYKTRKNEALRKLDATNQNLMRITDIISELKRQMSGLKRQAKKAERYQNNLEKIKDLDIRSAIYYYDHYAGKINETGSILKGLNDTDMGHSSRLQELDAAVEKIKVQRSQKNQEIEDYKSGRYEIRRTLDRMENDLAHLGKDVERLTHEIADLQSSHTDLEEKNKTLTLEAGQVENKKEGIKYEIKTVSSTLDREQAESQKIKNSLETFNRELETCKNNLIDLAAKEAQYKNIYQNAEFNRKNLNKRLEKSVAEETETVKKAGNLEKKCELLEKEINNRKTKIKQLNTDIDSARNLLAKKKELLAGQVKHVQTLEFEQGRIRSTYKTLRKMEDNFDWYKDGVRAIMKNHSPGSDKPLDNGVLGLMADIIEPRPSFETATEAVLGESLQYILVKNQKAGAKSIDYLQTTGSGRAGFIPVSCVKTPGHGIKKKSDPEKRLLNHVTVKPGFEKIAEAFLGHVVVSDDMDQALNLFNRNGALQTIVTKEGDIISYQGMMIGGSKEKLAGILAKKQEIKGMKRRIKVLDKQLEAAHPDQEKIESDVRSYEIDLQKLMELKNRAIEDEVESEKELYKITEDLKHSRRHLEIIRLEQEQLMGEKSDIKEKMTKYNKAVAEIEQKVKAARDLVSEKLEHIDTISYDLEDYDEKIVDLKLKLTSLNAGLENSNNTLKRLYDYKADGVKRLERLWTEIEQKKAQKRFSEEKIKEYKKRLSAMYNDLADIEKTIGKNEADYHAIDSKLKESDSIISDIKGQREQTLQKIRLLEIDQSQWIIKQENTANRLKESYHKTMAEFKDDYEDILHGNEPNIDELEEELTRLRKKVETIDDVNLGAIKEYEKLKERFDFLSEQREDLIKAVDDLYKVIKKINRITQKRFFKTFSEINEKLGEIFPRLFEGGSAKLVLTDPDNLLETGVEFMIHPPGKKLTRMSLHSGGEKALSAVALIFSIYLIKPAFFCLMDEIDASMDEVNIVRFNDLLRIIGEKSQIIMITHNKSTMEFADTLFGITMERKGISKVVSVNFKRGGENQNLLEQRN